MLRRTLENTLRALRGPVGILYHIVVVALSAGIALSLPVTVSVLAQQFLVYWSLIENEKVFLISVEIAVAVVLILFFHSIGRSWQDKRLARMARGAGMVYFTPSRGGPCPEEDSEAEGETRSGTGRHDHRVNRVPDL